MARTPLDLCGEVCPYTFVRTKLALEEIAVGDELEILLDHPAAFRNVPQALRDDGHLVLAVQIAQDQSLCTVLARKQGPVWPSPPDPALDPVPGPP